MQDPRNDLDSNDAGKEARDQSPRRSLGGESTFLEGALRRWKHVVQRREELIDRVNGDNGQRVLDTYHDSEAQAK